MYDNHNTCTSAIVRVRWPEYMYYRHNICAMVISTCTMVINARSTCMMAIIHVMYDNTRFVAISKCTITIMLYSSNDTCTVATLHV